MHQAGVIVDVVSLPSTYKRYENIPYVRYSYSLASQSDLKEIVGNNYDEAIDVTYVNANYWDLRQPLLASLRCHTLTISDMAQNSKLFDEFVDLGVVGHWQERNALLFNTILRPQTPLLLIPPVCFSSSVAPVAERFIANWSAEPHVYVNTVGRMVERTLTSEQVQAFVRLFNARKKSVGVFYTESPIEETEWVKRLPEMSFSDFTSVVKQCRAIITPDTSAVHIGSAFDIPVFGIYCGNNRDYWPQYAMQEVWAPISKSSRIFCEDDEGITQKSDFVYTHRKKPISAYSVSKLSEAVADFLESVCL